MTRSTPWAAPSRGGDGRGEGSGEVRGDGTGDGIGKGSPTRLPFLGTSGLRRERAVEGMACGARGRAGARLFTSSRFGKTPSGAPLLGLAPSCPDLRGGRGRPAPSTQIGESETASSEEQSVNEINRVDILEAGRFEDFM
ncbi:MAG: hypothetical protein H7Z16_00120 [Pyrinomonadaceae bacterium]|nr:hypothetical protein [Pyrinomonadaceae bacterium]